MSEAPTKFTRRHKLLLASLATVSLSLGAAGVVSATQNPASSTGGNEPASEEVPGVDCVDGLDAATGAECDGGPAANAANDPAEADTEGTEAEESETSDAAEEIDEGDTEGTEAEESETSDAAEEIDGVDCENGIDAATGAECDGGPAANPQDGADDATEAANE
ncbi:MAG: hypothetical protein ABIX10_10440 [Acidimicrobiales bacterium]